MVLIFSLSASPEGNWYFIWFRKLRFSSQGRLQFDTF